MRDHPTARLISVIEIEHCVGKGTKDDPLHMMRSYFTTDGVLLAETGREVEPPPMSPTS